MADQSVQNALLERRRKAAEARKNAGAAPPPSRPVIDLEPNADEDLIIERRKAQAAAAATGTPIALPVAPAGTTAVARPIRDRSRELSSSDVAIPKLKLSQAMSKVNTDDAVRQGNWYISTTSQNLGPEIYIVPVDMQMSYSKFDSGIGVVCRSFDLIHGEGDPGILCEGTEAEIENPDLTPKDRGCPHRLWTKDEATGKNVPPPCGKNYNYPVLILDPDNRQDGKPILAILTLRSTAAQTAKLINSIVTEGVLTDPVWHETVLKLGVEKKTNTRGTFFVPTVDYVEETGGRTEKRAAAYAESFHRDSAIFRRSMENDNTE